MSLSDSPSVAATAAEVNDPVRPPSAFACAASAGVHLALVPAHFHEAGLPLGAAFAVAAVALAVGALLVRRPPATTWAGGLPPLVLAGVTAWLPAVPHVGIPVLITDRRRSTCSVWSPTAAEVVAAAAGLLLLPNRKEHR